MSRHAQPAVELSDEECLATDQLEPTCQLTQFQIAAHQFAQDGLVDARSSWRMSIAICDEPGCGHIGSDRGRYCYVTEPLAWYHGCCIFLGILCLLRSDDTCSHWSSIPFFLLYNLQVNNSTISRLMTVHGR